MYSTQIQITFPNQSLGRHHKGTNVFKSTFVPLRFNDRLYSFLYIFEAAAFILAELEVTWGSHSKDSLQAEQPDFIVDETFIILQIVG